MPDEMPDETPQDDAYHLAGDRLGDYVILGELGRGAMGVVYEAFHEHLKRKVALKILPANIALDAKQVRRFRREAESIARLRHDNVIQIYEVGQIDQNHYFAMEKIDGQSIAEISGRDREAIRRAAHLAMQAARGLAHAHENGVIHRDIKPANLLVDRSDRVVVTDFGLARLTDSASLTSTDAIVGTPKYMSPEQILPGTRTVDGRTDIYSLGAMLYQVVAGRAAFDEPSVQAFIRAILEQRPASPRKFNRQIPIDLATIILRCLEKDPDDRYADADKLADDLQRFLAGERIHARPKGSLAIAFETARRHKVIAILSSVAAVALVLVLWLGGRARQAEERGQLTAALSGIQRIDDLDRAVREIEKLRQSYPKNTLVDDVRRGIYARHAEYQRRQPQLDPEGVLASLERGGQQGTFWHLMMLFETHRFEAVRVAALALPGGATLRQFTQARLALEDGQYREAVDLPPPPDGYEPAAMEIYYLLLQARALMAQARNEEENAPAVLESAAFKLALAQKRMGFVKERWLFARVELTRIRLENLQGVGNPAAAILDGADILREFFRTFTTFWGRMSGEEAKVAEAYVKRILRLAELREPPPDLEQRATKMVQAAARGRAKVVANLLLAVARLSGGRPVSAFDAFSDADNEGVDDFALLAYISWGYSFCHRAQGNLVEATIAARAALDNALETDFPDLETLARHLTLLGERAAQQDETKAAAADVRIYLEEKLNAFRAPWVTSLLARVRSLEAASAPPR